MVSTQAREQCVKAIEESICVSDILVDIITHISETHSPEDVFTEEQLTAWADENGFVRAE